MSTGRDPNPVIASWLDEGPTELPESNRRAIVTATRTVTQRRPGFGSPWRDPSMNGYTRVALTAAAIVVAAVGGVYLLNPARPTSNVGGAGPSASPATPTPRPTLVSTAVGTITLTDDGCRWSGNPGTLEQPGPVTIDVVNQTDTFASFDLHRLTAGSWDDAASWVKVEHAAQQVDPEREIPAPGFAEKLTDEVDAVAFAQNELTHVLAIPGTYGVVCSSNEPPPGAVFGIYLVGPLVVE